MSIFLNKYKKKYYPITSSDLNNELKTYALNQLKISYEKVQCSLSESVRDFSDPRYRLSETIQMLQKKVYLEEELTNEELEHLNNFVFLRYPRYSFSLSFGPYIILGLIIVIVYFFYGVLT